MRLVKPLLALALAAALPAPGAAQVGLPPLAPGEVLLQVSGLGQVRSRADLAMLNVLVVGQAGERQAAVRMAGAKLARAVAAVRAAGIPAADIEAGAVTADMAGLSTPVLMDVVVQSDRTGGDTAAAPLRIIVRDLSRLDAVRAALAASEAPARAPPEYLLADSSGPLREAHMEALRRARRDAEANAALRNMRIVRVARISERSGLWALGQAANEAETVSRMISLIWRVQALPEVETFASVAVDFVLAPR